MHVWPSSIVLARFVLSAASLFAGRHGEPFASIPACCIKRCVCFSVLELGSGCGAGGIAVGKAASPASVTLTDVFEHTFRNLIANVKANISLADCDAGSSGGGYMGRRSDGVVLAVAKYDWEAKPALPLPVDVIIASGLHLSTSSACMVLAGLQGVSHGATCCVLTTQTSSTASTRLCWWRLLPAMFWILRIPVALCW